MRRGAVAFAVAFLALVLGGCGAKGTVTLYESPTVRIERDGSVTTVFDLEGGARYVIGRTRMRTRKTDAPRILAESSTVRIEAQPGTITVKTNAEVVRITRGRWKRMLVSIKNRVKKAQEVAQARAVDAHHGEAVEWLEKATRRLVEAYNTPEARAKREVDYRELCRIGELRKAAYERGESWDKYPLPWETKEPRKHHALFRKGEGA